MRQNNKKNWDIYVGIFLISLVTLSFEVIVNRLFSLMFWYHFAFMIISIALFGIGFGGLLVFFLNGFIKRFSVQVLAILSLILAVVLPLSILIVNNIPLQMELVVKSGLHQKYFILFFLTLSVPFIITGFIFSFIFTNYRDDINKIYFFDLVGGGIGCFFTLIIFPHNGPFVSVSILSILAAIALFIFARKRYKYFSVVISLLILLVNVVILSGDWVTKMEPRISDSKKNLYKLGKKLYSDWDNFGYTVVHERNTKSLEVTTGYTTYSHMYDMRNLKNVFSYRGPGLDRDQYYPFIIKKKPENVGIVGVGSGRDVMISLVNGAKNVYGAEYNPTMFDIFMNKFSFYNKGLGHYPNVHIENQEGRFFIRSSRIKFDILFFDNAIAIAAVNSGAFTLTEGYLYTVEAFMDYIEHLSPEGVLYLSNPYQDYIRFITIAREAFRRLGKEKDFKDSIIVINNQNKSYPRCKVLIKNGKFRKSEIKALSDFVSLLKTVPKFLYIPDKKLNTYAERLITKDNIGKYYSKSVIEIRPSTDDWPFYSQFVKTDSIFKTHDERNALNKRIFEKSPFIMLTNLAKNVLYFSLLALIIPLVLFNFKGFKNMKHKVSSIIFFACIGFAFMLIEIVLMQKYMLILGHPVYSFSIVLSSLLITTGIGSYISGKISSPYTAILIGIMGILVSIILSFLFSFYIGIDVIDMAFWARSAIIIFLTGVSGLFMGFMMPSGIRIVSAVESSIPWLWSINSIFSVLASFAAVFISISFGFNIVLFLSAVVYFTGVLSLMVGYFIFGS